METLTERVSSERIKILKAQLEVAIRQRDGYRSNYHSVVRLPHQERHEIASDDDREIEQAGNRQID